MFTRGYMVSVRWRQVIAANCEKKKMTAEI